MKTIFALVTLLCMNIAFAQSTTTKLKANDAFLSGARASLVSVKLFCPHNGNGPRCLAIGSTVRVKVALNGCMDHLGGYFARFEQINGKGYLFFSAINVHNKQSMVAMCTAMPVAYVDVNIAYEGKVELVEMPYFSQAQ